MRRAANEDAALKFPYQKACPANGRAEVGFSSNIPIVSSSCYIILAILTRRVLPHALPSTFNCTPTTCSAPSLVSTMKTRGMRI